MRLLALDIGEKRIGVAVSDSALRVATPLTVLDASVIGDPRPLADLVDQYEVDRLVIGLPLSLDGTEGPQAVRVREVGTRLAEGLGMDVTYADERLSSAEASRAMRAAGLSDKQKRGRVDMVAAALILQTYLDAHAEGVSDRMPTDADPGRSGVDGTMA